MIKNGNFNEEWTPLPFITGECSLSKIGKQSKIGY